MEFATGTLGTLLEKLANLLHGEYKLQKNVKNDIEFLTKELEHTQATLRTVGEVPLEQLPELVKHWAQDARELPYDMEDVLDTFLVHVDGPNPPNRSSWSELIQKMISMLAAIGKRHQISEQINDIKERAVELAARRERYKVCKSIGNGMENSLDVENMRKILSYSYYDMPSYLRNCLLYLSIFPKDYEIDIDRLIWLWISEGFIQHETKGKKSLFELGQSYFNELINRSMIQPLYKSRYDSEISVCRVHDLVLDVIRSISSEVNFVTIVSNMDQISPSMMVRRLSLQNGKTSSVRATQATCSQSMVRSVVVFPSTLEQMPALRSFKVLRVLDLQGCDLSQSCSLQYLGSLFHLRFLNLRSTRTDQLPEEVGTLQFLEFLDVTDTKILQLPKCVAQLTHLLCLSVPCKTRVPHGIRSLTSLERLEWLRIDDESLDNIEGLGLLTELRVLCIELYTNKWTDKLLESLCKLENIQKLHITLGYYGGHNIGGLDTWVPPPQLRTLNTRLWCWFSVLPTWMNNPTQFQDLENLDIAIRELQQEDLVILGKLPALHRLILQVGHENLGIVGRRFLFSAGLFPCLEHCWLWGVQGPVVFQKGALPRVSSVSFEFHMPEAREIACNTGGFDLGLENLLSLQNVTVYVRSGGAREEAKAALRHAAEIHPNRPQLSIW